MSRPRLSIIIPTFNRRELLLKLLDAVNTLQAEPGELEVIVVDDGSTDGTREVLALRRDAFPVRWVPQASQGPSAARNRGAAEARGDILGFLDSDVVVQPAWWRAAAPHFQDARTAAVEGATRPPDERRPTPFTNYVSNTRGREYQTCNFLCRRDVFLRLGGFDGRYCTRTRGFGMLHNREDTDLAFSLQEAGYRIEFELRALVWHPLPPPFYGLHLRKAREAVYEALLRRRHPRLYREQLKWIDGRAFPVFYWGPYLGLLLLIAGAGMGFPAVLAAGAAAFLSGWAGSVYAICRKRRTGPGHLLLAATQMLIVPWLRLYWLLRGEWMHRGVKPDGAAR